MKRKQKKDEQCCHLCEHCVYIGEGDYICDENNDVVIADWEPTDDYFSCLGKRFEPIPY